MTEPKDCAREHPMSDYCGTHGTRLETCARLDALAASKDAALAALRERLAAAEKRAETAEALVRELAAVAKAAKNYLGSIDATSADLDRALAALSPAARKEIEG